MRMMLTTGVLAVGLWLAAADSASAQWYGSPGYGSPLLGQYWTRSYYYGGPHALTLPSYSYVAPGSLSIGYGAAYPPYAPYYGGYGYGLPYYGGYGYRGFGPTWRSSLFGYDNYGTFWGM